VSCLRPLTLSDISSTISYPCLSAYLRIARSCSEIEVLSSVACPSVETRAKLAAGISPSWPCWSAMLEAIS
jgi:hypothetical protein